MTRTDIHRPSAPEFDPQAYDYKGAFDLRPQFNPGEAMRRREVVLRLQASGCRFTGVHGSGQCDHCGASIRYAALLEHRATKGLIWVGEQCLGNRFDSGLSAREFHALRETARLNRERATKIEQERAKIRAAVAGMDDATADAFAWAQTDDAHPIAADIAGKVPALGPLSEKQATFLVRLHTESREKAQREQERASAIAAGTVTPCPEGRVTVRGTVKSTRQEESDFGTIFKMLVEDERGFRVWGTIPAALLDLGIVLNGCSVEFAATLQPKPQDPTFGFFSRPSKARRIDG